MPLGMKVGLDPSDIVLDGDTALLPKKGVEPTPPHIHNFRPCRSIVVYCCNDQHETWHGGKPRSWRHCVRWEPSSPSPKGAQPAIFGPCLLWPDGWIDPDVTWYRGRPRPRPHCARCGSSSPPPRKKGGGAQPPPIFGPCLLWQNDWIDQDGTWYGGGPWPRPHCVRWGNSSTPRGTAPNFRPMSVVAKRLDGSRRNLVRR